MSAEYLNIYWSEWVMSSSYSEGFKLYKPLSIIGSHRNTQSVKYVLSRFSTTKSECSLTFISLIVNYSFIHFPSA